MTFSPEVVESEAGNTNADITPTPVIPPHSAAGEVHRTSLAPSNLTARKTDCAPATAPLNPPSGETDAPCENLDSCNRHDCAGAQGHCDGYCDPFHGKTPCRILFVGQTLIPAECPGASK